MKFPKVMGYLTRRKGLDFAHFIFWKYQGRRILA